MQSGNDHDDQSEEVMRMLMRFDPFREFDRMTSQLFGEARVPRAMPMDAYRREDAVHVEFDLPGIDPDTIELTVENNVLTVSATRMSTLQEDDRLLANERVTGAFSRQVFLGDGLDTDHLAADYQNGVLHVTVPVSEAAKPRRIPIAISGGDRQAITAGEAA